MTANDPIRPIQPLTEFAQKYEIYNGSNAGITRASHGYKSVHTPVSPRRADESQRRKQWKDAISKYQSDSFERFPVEWVRALGAYIPTANADFASDWGKAELHNSIHPLIDYRQWETFEGCLMNYPPPLIDNGDPGSGFMVAKNKIVWDVLEPVLQLASRYLDNAHLWMWWDALLSEANSSNKRTEQSPYESDVQNLRFWMRKPEEVYKQTVQVKDLLRDMGGQWFFNLRSGFRNPTNGGLQEGSWLGVTLRAGGPGKGSITLSAELEPDRVMLVNYCASILTHEIAVFKSDRYPIMSNTYGLMLTMFNADFPFPGTHQARGLVQYLPPGKELEPHTQVRSLVSIEWMRMLLCDKFWDHYVNRYGGAALIPDAPQADVCMVWNQDKKEEYSSNRKYNDVFILPDCLITPGMPHGQKIAYQVANMRRNMQRQARDKLNSTLSTLPPIEGGPAHQAPGGPQAPGAPQAHETEQIHGGFVIQLSQGQGALTLAPRAPTPTLLYETPNDVPKPLTISEMETAARIAAHLRYFRNLLGLHCIATCAEDALWFHLAWLAKRRLRRDVSFKDWGYFLRVCNESGKMLSWNPETKLVRALKEGWESQEPAQSPLPHHTKDEVNFNTQEDLRVAINAVMKYTFDCSSNDRPDRVTWYDEDQLTYDFSVTMERPGTKLADFNYICLRTGPAGCIQYNAPNNVYKMVCDVDSYARTLSETTDIGTILPKDEVRNAINMAFDAIDMAETDIFQHPRRLLIDNGDWWEQALLQLLPEYFSIVPGENENLIAFTFIHVHPLESLRTLISRVQDVAVNAFIKTYFENPAAKRKIWPLELRKLYNDHQNDESLRISLPRTFFTRFTLKNDFYT
ncbi:hypothetical protein V501_05355, partial [Pseudogymnoascus sp. VKM F-4519 (FW-2642)]